MATTRLSQQEVERLTAALSDMLLTGRMATQSRPTQRQQSSSSSSSDTEDDVKEFTKAVQVSVKGLKKHAETLKAQSEAYAKQSALVGVATEESIAIQEAYNKTLKESSGLVSSYANATNSYSKHHLNSLAAHSIAVTRLTEKTGAFSNSLAKAQLNSSLLSASLLSSRDMFYEGTEEYEFFIHKLGEASEGLGESMLRQSGMWDETSKGIRDNLSPADFKNFRLKIGDAETAISETFAGLEKFNIKDIHDLAKQAASGNNNEAITGTGGGADQITNTLKIGLKQLIAQGHEIGGLKKDASDADIEAFARQTKEASAAISEFASNLAKTSKNIDTQTTLLGTKFGRTIVTVAAKIDEAGSKIGAAGDAVLKHLAADATIAAGFAKAKEGLGRMYQQLQDFNISQISASFADVNAKAIHMGLSFEETVKFLQANKRAMALYGKDFDGLKNNLGTTFQQFGFTLKQSAELIAPTIAAAYSSGGVDISKGDEVNAYLTSSLKSWQDVAQVTDITYDAFTKLNENLYSTNGISQTLLGLDKLSAKQYADDLVSRRRELTLRGISNEQAQAVIQANEAAQREKLDSRITEAGQLYQQMQATGFSTEEAMAAMQTLSKGIAATDDEKKDLAETRIELAKRRAQEQSKFVGSGNAQGQYGLEARWDAIKGNGASEQATQAAEGVALADKAGAGVTPEQKAAAQEKAKPSKAVTMAGEVVNSASSLANNAVIGAAWGATTALFGLAVQAAWTAKSMGGFGGKGGVVDKLLNVFGKGGKTAALGTESITAASDAIASTAGNVAKSAEEVAAAGSNAVKGAGQAASTAGNVASKAESGIAAGADASAKVASAAEHTAETSAKIAEAGGKVASGTDAAISATSTATEAGSKVAAVTEAASGATSAVAETAGLMGKLGSIASTAGKILGPLGSALDVGVGLNDLANGKKQETMPSGWDVLSPMKWGMYGGEKGKQGIDAGAQALGIGKGHSVDNFTDWIGDKLTGNKISAWSQPDKPAVAPAPLPLGKVAMAAPAVQAPTTPVAKPVPKEEPAPQPVAKPVPKEEPAPQPVAKPAIKIADTVDDQPVKPLPKESKILAASLMPLVQSLPIAPAPAVPLLPPVVPPVVPLLPPVPPVVPIVPVVPPVVPIVPVVPPVVPIVPPVTPIVQPPPAVAPIQDIPVIAQPVAKSAITPTSSAGTDQQNQQVNNKPVVADSSSLNSATNIINVADAASIKQLTAIADNTALSAKILQQMFDDQSKPVSTAPESRFQAAKIPTVFEQQTGFRA